MCSHAQYRETHEAAQVVDEDDPFHFLDPTAVAGGGGVSTLVIHHDAYVGTVEGGGGALCVWCMAGTML